jgi:TolA-binding protein
LATERLVPDAALAIGYTYEEQSKKKDAIKWFQRTCKLYPCTRNASEAHAHLQKNTASASPSAAQGKNDPARGVLTFVGLIGNPRLGCNPRSPR